MKMNLAGRWLATAVAVLVGGCYFSPEKPPVYGHIDEIIINNKLQELVEDLAKYPADLEYRDDSKLTPLGVAVLHCRIDAVKILLDHHARVGVRGSGGSSPLHLAAQRGCNEAILLLLAAHASVNEKDDAGLTPLGVAVQWHQTASADLLRAHGGKE